MRENGPRDLTATSIANSNVPSQSGLLSIRSNQGTAQTKESLSDAYRLPAPPMSPLLSSHIPTGAGWTHQLKWDGVRILALCSPGSVQLYSKKLLNKTSIYSEVTGMLNQWARTLQHPVLLDGEVVVMDPKTMRPSFPLVLQRERTRSQGAGAALQAIYVLFDLLACNGKDIRAWPYSERYDRLISLPIPSTERCFVTDCFDDGDALWQWVNERGWEGIVSKRLDSPYVEGKQHRDWIKKKKDMQLESFAIGYVRKDNRPSSIVLADSTGQYMGKASIGLDELRRQLLTAWAIKHPADRPTTHGLPASLSKEQIIWYRHPIPCLIGALEYTDAGLLRHPRILTLPLLNT